jgi:uncharacterized protein (DUF362 family)
MNTKVVKRIVLISLLVVMLGVFFGHNAGFFDNFLTGYKPNITPTKTDTVSSATSETDAVSSATSEVTTETSATKNTDIPITTPQGLETPVKVTNAGTNSIVSIVQSSKERAEDITYEEIFEMTKNAIDLSGGLKEIIKDNQTVVLKPNLVQMHVDSTGQLFDKEINGATTDWRVTKAVAELVRKLNPNGKILVMEGSAGDGTKKAMEHLNYNRDSIPFVDEFIAIEDESGNWQEYNSPKLVKYSLPDGLLYKEYYLNKKYLECDVLISIPCLKTNSGAVVSGSIKNVGIGATPANIYGVSPSNPGRTKMVSHKIVDGELDKWVYDYYICKPVDFVVMDGLQGFQNGPVPMGKDNVTSDRMNMRLIMAGKDSVSVDSIEALIAGWDPESITYLKYLSDSGMGIRDTSRITVVGKLVEDVRKTFKIRYANLGGVQVKDKTPPELSLVKEEISDGKLHINLNTSDDAVKDEVLVDDKLYSSIPSSDFKTVSIDISKFSEGNHTVKFFAYDKYLNHSEIEIPEAFNPSRFK